MFNFLPSPTFEGGEFIVRSNWKTYCEEMEEAVNSISQSALLTGLGTGTKFRVFPENDEKKMEAVTTHFERKYIEVGLKVFEFSAELGLRNREERVAMLRNIPSRRASSPIPPEV